MRRGELLGLRWKDVDRAGAHISVRQALVSVSYKVIVSTPKNHLARVIDLDTATVQLLRAHHEAQQLERADQGSGYQDSDLVFCRGDGTRIHPDAFSKAFGCLVARTSLRAIASIVQKAAPVITESSPTTSRAFHVGLG